MKTRSVALCGALFSVMSTFAAESGDWQVLFDGSSLAGWSPLIGMKTPGVDPGGHIVLRDGMIRMYANAPADAKVPFGSLMTERKFYRFHLKLETSWGARKFKPRQDAIRDAGLLFHVADSPRTIFGDWPESMECQIQEGDIGDIMFLGTRGITWLTPDPAQALEGQGDPGMLPEEGGVPVMTGQNTYIGRFPVADKPEGWNTVETIVQADESAVFKINGIIRSRYAPVRDAEGKPLTGGRIGVQLEGAEVNYRNILVRELTEPLRVSSSYASLSAVRGIASTNLIVAVGNSGNVAVPVEARIFGKDAASFSVKNPDSAPLEAGGRRALEIVFNPTGKAGRYSAGLQIGSEDNGAFVILQGIALDALEGENEPPLQRIVQSLGIPLDVGGPQLKLGTDAPVIGASQPATTFRRVGSGPVRITPLARFSPPGNYPFGWSAGGKDHAVGALADSKNMKDAHQRLFPPLENGAKSADFTPDAEFSLFINTKDHTVGTDPVRHPSKLAQPVRIYPVPALQGRRIEDALLVCFEEASNGDYQDSVFLMENAAITTPLKESK